MCQPYMLLNKLETTHFIKGDDLTLNEGMVGMVWRQSFGNESEAIKFRFNF